MTDDRTPPLARRLAAEEALVGLIMKMPSPASAELAGHLGYDLIVLDTEHGMGGGGELDHHIRAADSVGIPMVVRVSSLNRAEIARALDGGAAGVVIPQVEDADTAREAVRLAHYPPYGVRGLATSTRAGGQGAVPAARHLAEARQSTVVIVQIESQTGAANAAEILSVDGISAVWIGLSDLSLEMGHFGQLDHPAIADAVSRIVAAADENDVPLVVIADTAADGERWVDRGAQVLLVNLLTVVARGLGDLKKAHQLTRQERIPIS